MRKIYLLLFAICFCGFVQAQQNTFEKVIDTLGSAGALCIKETFDGGYVYCGKSNYGGNDAMIVKLDSVGTIEWAKVYSGPGVEGATFIVQTPDSGYMVNAIYNSGLKSKSWLLRLDANGDTLWTKAYAVDTGGATNGAQQNSMANITDTIYGLTGYFKPVPFTHNNAFFISCLKDGTLLASKIYDTSVNGTGCTSIDKTYDNGFVMAGVMSTIFNGDVYLIRTNAYGDTLWTRTYPKPLSDIAFAVKQTADSGFIVAGYTYNSLVNNIYLIKTNSAGDTLWTKSNYSTIDQSASSVDEISDGYIIAGTIVPTVNNGNVYLLKTDATGDTMWSRQFGGMQSDIGYFVKQTKDGGYIISGLNESVGISGGTYIIKTDSLGNVANGVGQAEINNPYEFSVFPNPSTGFFTLITRGIFKREALIEIYNVTNQCIYSCKVINNTLENIDLSMLKNGIYVIILRTEKNIHSKKIVIQK